METEDDRLQFLKSQKHAIIRAAEEDDEYDDTYDDVHDPEQDTIVDKNEEYLIGLVQTSPSLFHPSQRKSKERKQLKERLSWSDEQIEGWFVMLNRDPRMERRLTQFEWKGNQPIERVEKADRFEKPASSRGRGRGRGKRGRGRFHRPQG